MPDVPLDAIYKVYHMDNRLSHGYYVADLITEVMGGGGSSRLFQSLVKEKSCSAISSAIISVPSTKACITIEGKLVKGVTMEAAEAAIEEELEKLKREGISEKELTKVKNKTESAIAFEDMSVMTRCNNLAFYELLGDAFLFNSDREKYFSVTVEDVLNYSRKYFDVNNSCTLCYYSKH